MSKYPAFLIVFALRLFYQPSNAQSEIPPFSSQPAIHPAKLVSFEGIVSGKNIILTWVVEENESVEFFEVEKSRNGITFEMTGLVFGTDKASDVNYRFYEKAGNQKIKYRIKLVNKDKKTEYSPVVEINPHVK